MVYIYQHKNVSCYLFFSTLYYISSLVSGIFALHLLNFPPPISFPYLTFFFFARYHNKQALFPLTCFVKFVPSTHPRQIHNVTRLKCFNGWFVIWVGFCLRSNWNLFLRVALMNSICLKGWVGLVDGRFVAQLYAIGLISGEFVIRCGDN